MSTILGIDLGTTSIKVVLLDKRSRTVAASHTLPTTSEILNNSDIKVSTLMNETTYSRTCGRTSVICLHQAKEQHTGRIIETLNRCVSLLPSDALKHVGTIGLSGQMHGLLFWTSQSGKTGAIGPCVCARGYNTQVCGAITPLDTCLCRGHVLE